jgi:hypothetical protein
LGSGIVVVPLLAASVVLATGAEKSKRPPHHRPQPLSATKAYEGGDQGDDVLEAAARRPVRESPYVCPSDMAVIGRSYCVDVYEASLVQEMPDGTEQPWPYYERLRLGVVVRAISEAGVFPQGYVSGVQAREACERSGKRLCTPREWKTA